jgi:peptidoglycan/LPS O-acetylase OafA/YrhL
MTWQLSNFLRAIAITVVIAIHASHSWWFGARGDEMLSEISVEIFIDTFVNQVGRLAVPIFVILSGFGLAQAELNRPFQFWGFMQRRCLRILPPYVFFTLLNLSFRDRFQSMDLPSKLADLLEALGNGSGDYHLYFLVIIIQCYISYPLLRRCQFSPMRLVALLVITFSLFTLRWSISLFGWFAPIAAYVPDSNHCLFWLPYFLLGTWLAKHPDWFAASIKRCTTNQWGAIWAIASGLELSEFYFAAIRMGAAEPAGHYGRPTVVLLTLAFLCWAMSWQGWKRRLSPQIIEVAGKSSFTIYLLHTQVLRLIAPLEVVGGIAYLFVAAIASWVVGIIVWKLVKPIKGLNIILGA